jgi:hypothetical protein
MESEDFQIEAVRPPGIGGWGDGFGSGSGASGKRAFGRGGHSHFSLFYSGRKIFKSSLKKVL